MRRSYSAVETAKNLVRLSLTRSPAKAYWSSSASSCSHLSLLGLPLRSRTRRHCEAGYATVRTASRSKGRRRAMLATSTSCESSSRHERAAAAVMATKPGSSCFCFSTAGAKAVGFDSGSGLTTPLCLSFPPPRRFSQPAMVAQGSQRSQGRRLAVRDQGRLVVVAALPFRGASLSESELGRRGYERAGEVPLCLYVLQ